MHSYDFTLVLEGDHFDDFEEVAEKIYACNCNDASIAATGGTVSVMFDRQAETRAAAIVSAISDIQRAGYTASLSSDSALS